MAFTWGIIFSFPNFLFIKSSTMTLKTIIEDTGWPGNPIIGFPSVSPIIVGFPGLMEIPWINTPLPLKEFITLPV